MTVGVIAPEPIDPWLELCRILADRVLARLGENGEALLGPKATRSRLRVFAHPRQTGWILAAHGAEDRITFGRPPVEILFDHSDAYLTSGRHIALFACLAARQLAPAMLSQGAASILAFDNEPEFFDPLPT